MAKILVILGSTATGKTDLSLKLAKKFNGEIISADSRQVYEKMNLGTGKATEEEQKLIKHHLLDVSSPKRRFTVAQYVVLAKKIIDRLVKDKKLPLVVGGTGFYIQALIDGLTIPQVPPDWNFRKKLDKLSLEALQQALKQADRLRWARMNESDRANPRRLIRALEIIHQTGQPVPQVLTSTSNGVLEIGLTAPWPVIKERIRRRLLVRLSQGMVEEVARLHRQGVSWRRLEEMGLEYRWLSRFLQSKISDEVMVNRLYFDIVSFAKRQVTWFKKDKRIKWIDITEAKWENKAEKLVADWLEGKNAENH